MRERVMMLLFFTAIGLLPIIGFIDNALNPRDKSQNQKSRPGRFGDCGEDGAPSGERRQIDGDRNRPGCDQE
jgi:hypothetical protein